MVCSLPTIKIDWRFRVILLLRSVINNNKMEQSINQLVSSVRFNLLVPIIRNNNLKKKCRRSRIDRRFTTTRQMNLIKWIVVISTCPFPWLIVLAEDSTVHWNRRKFRKATLILTAVVRCVVVFYKGMTDNNDTIRYDTMTRFNSTCNVMSIALH